MVVQSDREIVLPTLDQTIAYGAVYTYFKKLYDLNTPISELVSNSDAKSVIKKLSAHFSLECAEQVDQWIVLIVSNAACPSDASSGTMISNFDSKINALLNSSAGEFRYWVLSKPKSLNLKYSGALQSIFPVNFTVPKKEKLRRLFESNQYYISVCGIWQKASASALSCQSRSGGELLISYEDNEGGLVPL